MGQQNQKWPPTLLDYASLSIFFQRPSFIASKLPDNRTLALGEQRKQRIRHCVVKKPWNKTVCSGGYVSFFWICRQSKSRPGHGPKKAVCLDRVFANSQCSISNGTQLQDTRTLKTPAVAEHHAHMAQPTVQKNRAEGNGKAAARARAVTKRTTALMPVVASTHPLHKNVEPGPRVGLKLAAQIDLPVLVAPKNILRLLHLPMTEDKQQQTDCTQS